MKKPPSPASFSYAQQFFKLEAAGGIILLLATALALIMANIGGGGFYIALRHVLHLPVNDGLMVVFFFLVGLEIKRETTGGSLATFRAASLPLFAAIGGMAVPALIFWTVNRDYPAHLDGWAIPSATDIAFALGVLSLMGRRVPVALRVLLLSIAVIDDLGAIIIIALFYSTGLHTGALTAAGMIVALMFFMNRWKVKNLPVYFLCGAALAWLLHAGGVHSTIAGVITAFMIPQRKVKQVEHALHPWVSYGIMPLFAFANAGVSLEGMSLAKLMQPLPLGIIAGLFIGKQLGVLSACFVAVKARITDMPAGAGWGQLWALSALCGIGFTMSLFIGMLAFDDPALRADVRLGVLAASLLASLVGYVLLKIFSTPPERPAL